MWAEINDTGNNKIVLTREHTERFNYPDREAKPVLIWTSIKTGQPFGSAPIVSIHLVEKDDRTFEEEMNDSSTA